MATCNCVAVRSPLNDISNARNVGLSKATSRSTRKPGTAMTREGGRCFEPVFSKTVTLQFLWLPLGPFVIELDHAHSRLAPVFQSNTNWSISFIKDFGVAWKPGTYEAQATPKASLDCVGQRLFLAQPSLHSCVVFQGQGFLWLNRVHDEPFLRCTWLDDTSASLSVLPPLNLCFDLDETLIFNAEVAGSAAPLEFLVKEAPHVLRDDCPDQVISSTPKSNGDSPYLRLNVIEFLELVCPHFRNVRLATFSVGSRAKEIADLLDPRRVSLLKNYRSDPITAQKPVANVVFARELLLQQGRCLSLEEYNKVTSGTIFWLKSLEMLDLPVKGLLQRSIIVDDRSDVWVERNQDNVVKISGPDKPQNLGRHGYLNGVDGGEVGKRILLTLINLEFKTSLSPAFNPSEMTAPLAPPVSLVISPPPEPAVGKTNPSSLSPSYRPPTAAVCCTPLPVYRNIPGHLIVPTPMGTLTPVRHGTAPTACTLAGGVTVSPPTKALRSSLAAGFSQAREREQKEKENLRERGIAC